MTWRATPRLAATAKSSAKSHMTFQLGPRKGSLSFREVRMATPSDLIRVARAELGATSGKKYWDWYWGGTWEYVDGSHTPFCACGESWCQWAAGVTCEGHPRAVAIDRRDGFRNQVEPEDLQQGDIVGFDWDYDKTGDHVGIFLEWIEPGVSFRTIEFNTTAGPCAICVRYVYQVTIGVRPDYDYVPQPTLDVDGIAGPLTIKAWQLQLDTGADGIISDQLADHDRYRRNVWAIEHGNGMKGSALVREVQERVGAHVDGDWGQNTSHMLQLFLKDHGYYDGGIDDDFGYHSVMALQRSINDGLWA